MKKFFLSAAIAAVLTIVTSTAQLAMSKEVRVSAEAKPAPLKCAIYVGDTARIRPHGPLKETARPCESYWANDTAEDERVNLQIRDASAATPTTAAVTVKR